MNGNWIKTEDGDSYSDFWGLIYLNEDDMAHWQGIPILQLGLCSFVDGG